MSGSVRPPDCGHDAAPYLLGALEPGEARVFEDHLEGCAVCRDELAALAPVLRALPDAAPARRAPRGLRRRVLRAVRAESKVAAVPRGPRRIRAVARSPLTGWLALGATMAAAGLIMQLGSVASRERVVPARVGQAQLRVAGDRGELVVARLPALPRGRTYELWVQRGSREPAPGRLFGVTARGTADVAVPNDLHGVSGLLVTAEPRAGSRHPTSPAVIQIVLDRVPPPTTTT